MGKDKTRFVRNVTVKGNKEFFNRRKKSVVRGKDMRCEAGPDAKE